MSPFEAAAFDWYIDYVDPFSSEVGIVADSFRELGLVGPARRFFLRAMNMIRTTFAIIRAEESKQ